MKNKKNIVCIITARGGSKGIPNKNMINVAGKPLVKWSIDVASCSKYLGQNNIYVTSDDENILDISIKSGAKPIKRPKKHSTDTATSESALLHSIEHIEKLENRIVDIVVFLSPTSPIREPKDINEAIDKFFSEEYDSLFSSCKIEDFFIWEKTPGGQLISSNYDYRNRKRRQDIQEQYVENGSIYIFKKTILTAENNRLGGNIGTYLMEDYKIYEIDKKEDVEICEYYLNKIYSNENK